MKTRALLLLGALTALLGVSAAALAGPANTPVSAWQALPSPAGQPIQAFAASPAFPVDHTLFAGTSGGLFRSDDAGQHWSPLGTGPTGIISGTLKIVPSPAYPTDQTLFVLTRAADPPGRRVLRSTDAGATWQTVWESDAVQDLVVSPNYAADGTLFLGGARFDQPQVYRSIDRGDTWLPTAGQPASLDVYLLAISPHFAADQTLFAAGYGPMHRSTDGGATWQPLSAAGPNYSLAISPNFAADRTLWAMYREIEGSAMQPEAGIIRSTDGGATWRNVTAGLNGNYNQNYRSLAPDPSGNAVYLALMGPQWDQRFPPRVYRSDNGGSSWAPQELLPGGAAPQQVLPLGPLPDLFVLAEGVLYRSASTCYEILADGGFETDPDLIGYPGIAAAWEIPATAHRAAYTTDPKLAGAWAMRSGIRAGDPNVLSYSDFRQRIAIPADAVSAELRFYRYPIFGDTALAAAPLPLGGLLPAGPDAPDYQYVLAKFDDDTYRILQSWRDDHRRWVETTVDLNRPELRGRSFRLQFGVYNNGTGGISAMFVDEVSVRICRPAPRRAGLAFLPLILRHLPAPPPATATPTPTLTPTATATPSGGCSEGITNGGFETDAAWIIKSNPVLAAYVTSPMHSGSRSMRTGIPSGGANVVSYSPIEQAPPMPGGMTSTLRFWRYNVWGDGGSKSASAPPLDSATLPKTLDELYNTPLATDYFYAIAIKPDDSIVWLMTERANNSTWRQATIDLSSLGGIPIRLQFGTYNNGTGGISRTFVDDVSLLHCPSTPTPTRTPSPTFTATSSPTPTSSGPAPTASPTATRTPIPTAIPEFVPTPYWSGQLNLPTGSRPHGVAVSEDGRRVYVAFHGVDHSGRTLGVVNEYLSLQAQIDLGPVAQGPNGVALIPGTERVVTANRQTANATVVDVAAGAAVQNIAANPLPDGVIVHGGYGYIANFGNDTVTVFDPSTLAVIRTLHGVGHEPAMLAADTASTDVYLSAHGSDQVFVLRDGQVASHWDNIPEPYGLSYDPASRRLYVANRGDHHTVTVLDVYHDWVVGTIELLKEPFVLLVNPDSGHLFVTVGDYVWVYNTLDWSQVTSIPVPPGAEEGIAFDPRLSKVFVTSRDSDALTVIQDQGPAQVVFASDRGGNGELFRMLPDGRNQVRLTFTTDVWETAPAGSPSGRWIAYERAEAGSSTYSQIWLMSRDGRGAFMLTDGPFNNRSPSWSADSTKLAIASDRDGDWEIYVLDLATLGLVKLTDNAWDDLDPDWSKISGRIAFASCQTPSSCELFSMAADGSDVRQLTAGFNDSGPTWSPGGDRIAFYGSRPAGQALYTMRADGSDVAQFVPQSLRPASPAWGFVGDTLVFSGYRPGSGYSEIMRIAADSSGLVLLTDNEVNFDYAPGWLAGW